jgi:internalin A
MNASFIPRKPVAVALAAAVALGLCLPASSAAADPPVLGSTAAPAVVDIPDPNLHACLAKTLRLAPSAVITTAAGALRDDGLPTQETLSCPAAGIRDLTGLDQLGVEWWRIDLSDNDISDIGPIARLPVLPEHIDLSGNKISDLSPLNGVTTSTGYVDLSYNEIKDIRPLAQLPYVGQGYITPGADTVVRGQIHLDGNHISDLTPFDQWGQEWTLDPPTWPTGWPANWTAADQVIDELVLCLITDDFINGISTTECGVWLDVAISVGEITWAATPGTGSFAHERFFDTGRGARATALTWEAGTFTGTVLARHIYGQDPYDYAPIRDAGLLRCLDVALGLPYPSLIPVGAVVGADGGVDCSGQSIRRLDGIDSLDWSVAQELDLSDNEIRDLVVPAYAPALLELDLSGNRIQDVAPLTLLPGLHSLDLADNRVADIAPLAQLGDLGLGHNHICYSDECIELWVWGSVNLDGNRITDISPLVATLLGQGASGGTLSAVGQSADLGLVSAETTVFPVIDVSVQPVPVTGGSSTTAAGGVTFAAPGGPASISWEASVGEHKPSEGTFSGSADVWVEGPETSLRDPALAECVGVNVGLKAGATLTTDMTASRLSLDCSGRGISTLEGLASFAWQSLRTLDLSDNDLVDIPGVKKPNGGDSLVHADLSGNRITDPSPILQRENLVELDLSGNQIADLSAFAALPADRLRGLDLSRNLIADVAPLAGLTSLGTTITDLCVFLTPVLDCREAGGYLLLDGNRILDLGPLDGLTALQAPAPDSNGAVPAHSALDQRPVAAEAKTGTFPLPVNAGQFGPVAVQVASGDAVIDVGQVTYRSAGPVVLTWTGEKFSGEVTQNVASDGGGGGLATFLAALRAVIQQLVALIALLLGGWICGT